MTPEQAARLVAAARRDAETAARHDLLTLQAQGLQAGRRRAAELLPPGGRAGSPLARLNTRSTDLLRAWYGQVFAAALSSRLGGPADVPGVAGIDATATVLRRELVDRGPDLPLRLVGSLHGRARTDAAATTAQIQTTLIETAPRRAGAWPRRAGAWHQQADGIREEILQHWHQRCYLATVHAQLGLLQPLQAVTAAETREVAVAVAAGQARRLIGADGIPLVNAHGTAMTDTDRRLAAGDSHVVDPPQLQVTNALLRRQVTKSWNSPIATDSERDPHHSTWAKAAGVPDTALTLSWHELPGEHQSHLIAAWLDTHRDQPQPRLAFTAEPPDRPFQPELLTGPPRAAAAAMFNHHPPDVETVAVRQVAAAMYPAQSGSTCTARPDSGLARLPTQQIATRSQER